MTAQQSETPGLDVVIECITRAVIDASSELLPYRLPPRPQIHLFDEAQSQPYLGYVVCRYYERGQDAIAAVTSLGRIAAAMCASRLMVIWEESDLRTSFMTAGAGDHHGLAFVEATLLSHAVHWHPFYYSLDAATVGQGIPMKWGPHGVHHQAPLHDPISALLNSWRLPAKFPKQGPDSVAATLAIAYETGYEFHLTTQPEDIYFL
jgi:hypothetical protein